MKYERVIISIITFAVIGILTGCIRKSNHVFDYLENAELQYENESQKENIINAINDILTMPSDELEKKKYMDYSGNDNQWDLVMLINRHFVPDAGNKTLGENFYADVKSAEVQSLLRNVLNEIQ